MPLRVGVPPSHSSTANQMAIVASESTLRGDRSNTCHSGSSHAPCADHDSDQLAHS